MWRARSESAIAARWVHAARRAHLARPARPAGRNPRPSRPFHYVPPGPSFLKTEHHHTGTWTRTSDAERYRLTQP
eukprot:6143320-Prymnesium_polylepis.1